MSDWTDYINSLAIDLTDAEERTLTRYLTHLSGHKSESTVDNYRSSIRTYTQYLDDNGLSLSDVEPRDIQHWVDQGLADGYAPRSVRTRTYNVGTLYQRLERDGVIDDDPTADIDVAHLEQTQLDKYQDDQYLTIEEYKQLRDAADTHRNRLAIKLLWETGARASEAVKVRLSDINRDDRTIHLRGAKGGRHESTKPRDVYYSRDFARSLTKWLDGGRRKQHAGAHRGDRLLPSKSSPALTPGRLADIVRETAEKAGIQEVLYTDKSGRDRRKVHTHVLRKSYAVHRIRSDTGGGSMPLPYLQDLLGHEDISTTRDRYLKYRQTDVREAEREFSPTV